MSLLLGGAPLALSILGACSSGDGSSSSGTPAGQAPSCDVQAVLAASCVSAGCHAASEPAAGLDLASDGVEARLVEVGAATCDRTLVVPGDPGLSFLYEKVSTATPQCGELMPTGGFPPLSEGDIACIADWIAAMPAGCETCGGAGCADLQSDVSRCGDCDTVCAAGASCEAGACVCPNGGMGCGGSCVDTMSNGDHCGGCDQPCNGPLVCSLGSCKMGCDGGLTVCGGGCVDTMSDPQHCGDCDTDCGPAGSCDQGMCSCGAGIDTMTDPNNCGSCGHVCAPGQSCEMGSCTCANASVSFAADVQPILTASCATNGCHKGVMPQEGLNLSAGQAYGQLVSVATNQCNDGRKRVLPGEPAQSYVIQKMLGINLCFGTKMPKLGMVPLGDIQTISNWICAGAPNN